MREITKVEPLAYANWRTSREGPLGAVGNTFDDIDGLAKSAIREGLYDEQCGLDAYTGERIRLGTSFAPNGRRDGDAFHVEHMYPQDYCSATEAVDYGNMAGCRPGRNEPDPTYGAKFKDRKPWPSEAERHLFVLPTSAGCETRFQYTSDGYMEPADPDDVQATRTIEELNLGSDTTTDRKRRREFERLRSNREAVYRVVIRDRSLAEARRDLAEINRKEQHRLVLPEFSFVRSYALGKFIRKVEARQAAA